jgi:deoxyadenosine/deoxycytidine kinase
MKQWSFHLQVFFLGHRAQQHLEMFEDSQSAIIDRSIYEDAFIFVRALHAMGNIDERDYDTYRQVFDLVVKNLPSPSLLIYLDAPVETLMKRIHSRGREMENSISADYLTLLENYYSDWIAHFDLCPVMTLRTDDLDFVHKPQHLDIVVNKIQERLTGKEEIVF